MRAFSSSKAHLLQCASMPAAHLNLVVLRVSDLERSVAFYRLLELEFVKHAHGSGPLHYASEVDGVVFELYPSSSEQPVCASTRIGFEVANIDEVAAKLGAAGAKVVSPPKDSEWGRRAVIADPDGHRVELAEAS
jgi:lactoylglutathione lyase